MTKILVLALSFTVIFTSLSGAERDSVFIYRIDFSDRWIWRGINLSETPVIQPSFSYVNNRLKLSLWGSYSFKREKFEEIDLTAEYKLLDNLILGITDYIGYRDTFTYDAGLPNFNPAKTHLLDGQFLYKLPGKIPLSFYWSTLFRGIGNNNLNKKNNFSSYYEIRYDNRFGDMYYRFLVGGTPREGLYNNGPGIVNIGAKAGADLPFLKSLSIPTEMAMYYNPQEENIFMVITVSLMKY